MEENLFNHNQIIFTFLIYIMIILLNNNNNKKNNNFQKEKAHFNQIIIKILFSNLIQASIIQMQIITINL